MKELEVKQKEKQVRNYIEKRFNNLYYGENISSDWEMKSNGELENIITDFKQFTIESVNELKEEFNTTFLFDEEKDEEISFYEDPLIREFIKDESWTLIYNEIKNRVDRLTLDKDGIDNLNNIVKILEELISLENTNLFIKEILTSRVGLEEKIIYKSK